MPLILAIESSTKNCSVAIGDAGKVIAVREESSNRYVHSEKMHSFIDEVLREADVKPAQLKAVAVGKGPGSYTGLRIGVSAAKGLCYSLKIPLIAVDSLQLLAQQVVQQKDVKHEELILPMIDARRMEVYCAVYNHDAHKVDEIQSLIIDGNTFSEFKAERIWIAGDGASKTLEVLPERFHYSEVEFPGAVELANIAQELFLKSEFENVAYFEPFYLKDFIAGKPKKLL